MMKLNDIEIKKLKEFEKKIGVKFKSQILLKEALIHRSYLNEATEEGLSNNERLEFLGDAVLELITTQYIFNKYPTRPEGELTSFRAAIVRTESLAQTALKLGFSEFLYMSRGEEASGGRNRPYILANAFEAVLGAVYLDQGIETAQDLVLKSLLPKLGNIVKNRLDIDAKSRLQEVAQEVLKKTPIYEITSEKGPDHDKEFEVKVLIGEKPYGTGRGKSKQEAEQNAAADALRKWRN